MTERPLVSVLISTYNRSRLLRRALSSVLMQDFSDFEIVVIDDCSTDDTRDVVASIVDPRIRYFRNDSNVGARLGDRAHVQRFVYELMRGTYFVYLCDDDYWLFPTLLRRQVEAFRSHDNLAFVMGNQLCYFLTTPDSYFGRDPSDTMTFTRENIDPYFDLAALACKSPHLSFFPKLFSKDFLTSDEYLAEFASDPTTKNRIVGATLYSRDHFVRAGGMRTAGSKWQAGYEFLMGPACVGNVVYLDEPSIVTEIRASNASFQRTQVEHYLDSIKSVEIAFQTPLADLQLQNRAKLLKEMKDETIRNLSRAFLTNALTILREGALGLCSEENIRHPLTLRQVLPVLIRNRVRPGPIVWHLGLSFELENSRSVASLRAGWMRARSGRLKAEDAAWRALRVVWRSLPNSIRNRVRLMLGI